MGYCENVMNKPTIKPNFEPRVRITGGRTGFARAIREAFIARIVNPTIRYSQERGFHVESGLSPADHDVVWSHAVNYRLDLGHNSIRPTDYPSVRDQIIAHIGGAR